MSLDIEQFIQDVQNQPAIWNRNYHSNKFCLETVWRQMAIKHNVSIFRLKTKWKGLRDNFRVEFKRIPRDDNGDFLIDPYDYHSKWTHFRPLLFLSEHMRSRQPKQEVFDRSYSKANRLECESTSYLSNDLIQIPDEDDIIEYRKEQKLFDDLRCLQVPSGAAATVAETILDNDHRYNDEDDNDDGNGTNPETKKYKVDLDENRNDDDDYHFLLSLHPYMTELSLSQKLRVRMKMQKIVFKELFKTTTAN